MTVFPPFAERPGINGLSRNITPVGQFEGRDVHEIALRLPEGPEARILTWGAVIRDLTIPVGPGQRQGVVLGFDSFADYPVHSPYFGAVVGRYANRISGGGFMLDGIWHALTRNEGTSTTLHGGPGGFSQLVWDVLDLSLDSVTLGLTSPDGDQGFPGAASVRCRYSLTSKTTLRVEFSAHSTRATVFNLSQHAYFNLDGSPTIEGHSLRVWADSQTEVGPDLIPNGRILPVAGTALDLSHPRLLSDPGLCQKLDHNFVLTRSGADRLQPAARLTSAVSGLSLTVLTTKPGLQVYDGHLLDVPVPGLNGQTYGAKAGLCLEPQFFPDSPNQPGFPSARLEVGEIYNHVAEYVFERPAAVRSNA